MIILENWRFRPSPPASVEIKMLLFVLNSSSASLRSSILIPPFRIVTVKPRFSSTVFKYACVATNSVKTMIFWFLSSLKISSIVSISFSTLTSGYWNSACLATAMIRSSSSISASISKDIASIASSTPSSISSSARSSSVREPILMLCVFNTCKRRSKLWRTAAVLLVTIRCMMISRKIKHIFFFRFRRALS